MRGRLTLSHFSEMRDEPRAYCMQAERSPSVFQSHWWGPTEGCQKAFRARAIGLPSVCLKMMA